MLRFKLSLALAMALGLAWPQAEAAMQLDVKPKFQETDYWCWAACAEMVIEYVHPRKDVSQCELAQFDYVVPSTINCCNEGDPGYSQCVDGGAFPYVSFFKNDVVFLRQEEPLRLNRIKQQINQNQPLIFAFRWEEDVDAGHMVVITGYAKSKNKNILIKLDPNPKPQIGTETYLFFTADYDNNRHWETWYELKAAD